MATSEPEEPEEPAELVQMKRCARCGEHKPVDEFYTRGRGDTNRMPYCRKCEKARAKGRKPTSGKILLNRARHRATSELVRQHKPHFERLLEYFKEVVREEAQMVADAAPHDGAGTRLRPGSRAREEGVADRVDEAWFERSKCPECTEHHRHGHACEACGAPVIEGDVDDDEEPDHGIEDPGLVAAAIEAMAARNWLPPTEPHAQPVDDPVDGPDWQAAVLNTAGEVVVHDVFEPEPTLTHQVLDAATGEDRTVEWTFTKVDWRDAEPAVADVDEHTELPPLVNTAASRTGVEHLPLPVELPPRGSGACCQHAPISHNDEGCRLCGCTADHEEALESA